MAAAPAGTFSFSSVEPLLLSASPAAASRNGRRGDSIIRHSVAAPNKALLPSDLDLQQEGLKTNIQKILHQRRSSGREMIVTIDNLKRLCIDQYFEEEIESSMGACMDLLHNSDDLFDATLAFRLMREAGHDVSADDVLRRFTDDTGEFKLTLSKDIRGLLSLHDMSHLDMGEDASLYKAKEFSSKHLASAIRYLEPDLARYVRQSLDHPYHLSLMQYKARHHLSYLQSLPNRGTTAMEELAIAEFQLNKQLHQKEMQEVEIWWMDLGLSHEIPVVRDQVLKWYMWSVATLEGPSLSRYRVEITKIISLVYVVDDIFDLVGTPEELSLFTEAIKTWNTVAADSLPISGIRSCYKAIYTSTNEIADMVKDEHGFNPINHLRNAWAVLFDGFMVEARWLATDQAPGAEDYLRNGAITSGVPLTFAHIFAMLGYDESTDVAKLTDDHHIPTVISCPAKILRLWDDLGSAEDESQQGLDGSYRDFYLMENPGCIPGDAEVHMRSLIKREWEELNRECFSRRTFSSRFTKACLNTARMVSVMYSYTKEQKLLVLEDYARMFLL